MEARTTKPTGGTPLTSVAFGEDLETLLKMVKEKQGALFVARNKVPTVFLGDEAPRVFGAALHHSEERLARYVDGLHARAELIKEVKELTVVIPDKTERWLFETSPPFYAKSEVPGARTPSVQQRQSMWASFTGTWCRTGSVRFFRAGACRSKHPLAQAVKTWIRLESQDELHVTTLPDIWLGCAASVLGPEREDSRDKRRAGAIVRVATDLITEAIEHRDAQDGTAKRHELTGEKSERLARAIDEGSVHAIKVSGAAFNPRYRGQRLNDWPDVRDAVVHLALTYLMSLKSSPAPRKRQSSRP